MEIKTRSFEEVQSEQVSLPLPLGLGGREERGEELGKLHAGQPCTFSPLVARGNESRADQERTPFET